LIFARCSWLIEAASRPNTRAAVSAWKSWCERNASISAASSDRCAMMRISIWL